MKFISYLIYFFFIFSCNKTENNIEWIYCKNPVAYDLSFRLGLWIQNPSSKTSIAKIKFINDSIIEIYEGYNNKWQTNVNYKFNSCNSFRHHKYWIKNQLPNNEYNDYYITSFNLVKMEWNLIRRDEGIPLGNPYDFDTFFFKKSI